VAVISILASPPSIHSVRAHAKVLNRFVRSVAVVGLLFGAVRLSSAPSTGLERTAQRINEDGAQVRVARVKEPLGSGPRQSCATFGRLSAPSSDLPRSPGAATYDQFSELRAQL